MPYKKKSYRRKGGLKKFIKKTIAKSQETKTLVTTYANGIQDAARNPLTNSVTACAQGLDQDDRIGNRVTVTSLKYDWFFVGADTTNSIRVIFYIPKDPTYVLLGLGYASPVDLDTITVLKDMFICTSATGPDCVRRQGWLRFNRGMRSGIQVEYSGALSTEITRNKIMCYMVSDSTVVSDPQVNGSVRCFYKDA